MTTSRDPSLANQLASVVVTLLVIGVGIRATLRNPAVGEALLVATLVALLVACVLGLLGYRDRRAWLWERRAWLLAGLFIATTLAALVTHFLTGNLQVRYVWSHTSSDYPWHYRLAGTWGGQEGTILLWATCITLLGVLLAPGRHAPTEEKRLLHGARVLLSLPAAALVGLTLAHPVWRLTEPGFLAVIPKGAGLQEVLITPLMVIHPPLQFVAYALIAIPAALALSGVAQGLRGWSEPALRWARLAWTVATLGLGLGALWAYYVLSFGGFWAWDPVETANLLPWLTLTAFLHASKQHSRHGDFGLAAPALAAITFALTFFTAFATRSGLWVSVHAFTDPAARFDPDAASRLVGILAIHLPTAFFLGVIGAILGVTAAILAAAAHREAASGKRVMRAALKGLVIANLASAALAAAAPATWLGLQLELGALLGLPAGYGVALVLGVLHVLPLAWAYVEAPEKKPAKKERVAHEPASGGGKDPARSLLRRATDLRVLMAAAVTLFIVSFAVTAILNFSVVNGMNRFVFDARAPFLAVPVLLLLTIAFGYPHLGRRNAVILAGAALALGLAGYLLFPDRWVLALAAPALAAALFATVLRLVASNKGAKGSLRAGGVLVLLAGLLGAVMWSNPPNHLNVPVIGAVNGGLLEAFTLVPLALLGIAGGIAALRATGYTLALLGGVAATATAGYGIGALLGAIGLALIVANRRAFDTNATDRGKGRGRPRSSGHSTSPTLVRMLPSFKQSGIYLIHAAIVIGLFGYATATYEATYAGATVLDPAHQGIPFEAGDLTVTFMGMRPGDQPGDLHGIVHLHDSQGRFAGEATLYHFYRVSQLPRYLGEVDVHRGLTGDKYFVPHSFAVDAGDGELEWIEIGRGVDPTRAFTLKPTSVVAAAFDVVLLPFIGFVWAGLYLSVAGGFVVAIADALERRMVPRGSRAGLRVRSEREVEPLVH